MARNPVTLLRALGRSYTALALALRHGGPGLGFDLRGRLMGWRLLAQGQRIGAAYALAPVSSTRYFEFAFAEACLAHGAGPMLDLSSPRLFALDLARRHPTTQIVMLNPDHSDLTMSALIARRQGLRNLDCLRAGAELLPALTDRFTTIWSLSVLEHIAGPYDDRNVITWLYRALRPGGQLIVTVPVDRHAWDEYREQDYYGQATLRDAAGRIFFQRFYDQEAIETRLIAPLGRRPSKIVWYGEREPGHFHQYIATVMQQGLLATVTDAAIFTRAYQIYPSWEAMPGVGVCGLCFTRETE
ncbi:MAG: class I SAM-dependent methyltransferase [Oscillochloridaceae bacterium umkhey_bin13]